MYNNCDEDETMRNMFHRKITRMEEDNANLREEITKLDERNSLLEKQYACLKRQLEQIHEKHKEVQRECDKQKAVLDEVVMREKMLNVELKRSMKEKQDLSAKLEAAELEAQETASLKEQLTKVTSGKFEYIKQIAEINAKLDEKNNECEFLMQTNKELEEINKCLQMNYDSRENMIQVLRANNRELADENAELKSLVDINVRFSTDGLSTAPNSEEDSYRMHSTFEESSSAILQDSLFDELRKVTVFTNTCDKNDSINRQLEDQIHWYELEIRMLLEQTESAFKQLESTYNEERACPFIKQNLEYNDCSENTKDFETLKQRIQILLNMAITTSFKNTSNNIDVNTQVRADSREIEDLREFSILNFFDYLSFRQNKVVVPRDISNNNQDPFLSAKLPKMKIVSESSIIDPIVEALDKIVLHSTNLRTSPKKKDPTESLSLNKYKSVHTLTFRQNSHKETAYVRSDILHGDGDFSREKEPAIVRGFSQLIANGIDVNSRSTTNLSCRRSKSETNLVNRKKSYNSLNIATLPSGKKHKVVGMRQSLNDLTSKDRESRIFGKSNRANLKSVEELRDTKSSVEENNNVLQVTNVYTPVKSDIILNDISKQKQADQSKPNLVGEEEKLSIPVSHICPISRTRRFATILISPLRRVFISSLLVFISLLIFIFGLAIGFYITNSFVTTSINAKTPYKWWSFEEIFNRYVHVANRDRLPPV